MFTTLVKKTFALSTSDALSNTSSQKYFLKHPVASTHQWSAFRSFFCILNITISTAENWLRMEFRWFIFKNKKISHGYIVWKNANHFFCIYRFKLANPNALAVFLTSFFFITNLFPEYLNSVRISRKHLVFLCEFCSFGKL